MTTAPQRTEAQGRRLFESNKLRHLVQRRLSPMHHFLGIRASNNVAGRVSTRSMLRCARKMPERLAAARENIVAPARITKSKERTAYNMASIKEESKTKSGVNHLRTSCNNLVQECTSMLAWISKTSDLTQHAATPRAALMHDHCSTAAGSTRPAVSVKQAPASCAATLGLKASNNVAGRVFTRSMLRCARKTPFVAGRITRTLCGTCPNYQEK